MYHLLKKAALLCAIFAASLPAIAQTAVVGNKVIDNTGALLASGQWCFGTSCFTVTNGAFSGSVTAGTATVTVTNGSTTTYLTVPNVTVAGSYFSWDTYVVPSNGNIYGIGVPRIACTPGALYSQTDGAQNKWQCISQNGAGTWNGLPAPGTPNTFSLGTVTTLPPGAPATAVNVGSSGAPVINLGIPQGYTGCTVGSTCANVLPLTGGTLTGPVNLDVALDTSSGGTGCTSFNCSYNMPRWRAALQKVKTGNGNARACFVGDSTIFGTYSNCSGAGVCTGNNQVPTSIGVDFSNYLIQQGGIKSAWDSWFGAGTTTANAPYDARLTMGSSWSMDTTTNSLGWSTYKATTSTNAFSFTPTGTVNTFRVFYVINPSAGTLSLNIDGGTATIVNANGAAAVGEVTLTASSVGTHTINAYWSSGGPVWLIGEDAYDSTSNKVLVELAGSPGQNSTQMSNTAEPYGGGNSSIYSAIGCDVTVLEDGPNDWNYGVPVATFQANMQTVISALLAAGSDVALYSTAPSNPADFGVSNATQSTYVEGLRSLSESNSNNGLTSVPLPFIDQFNLWQSFAVADTYNWYGDGEIHPGTIGTEVNAFAVASALASFPAQNTVGGALAPNAYGANLNLSGTASASILEVNNSGNGATGYSNVIFRGSGEQFNLGTGNSGETEFGVANKFYLFDYNAQRMDLAVDSSGNMCVGCGTPYGTTFNEKFAVGSSGQFNVTSYGQVSAFGYTGNQTATVTPGAAAGGGTAVCDTTDGFHCTNFMGVVTVVEGPSPAAGTLFSLSWPTAFTSAAGCFYSNFAASATSLSVAASGSYYSAIGSQAYIGTAPTEGATYKILYFCGN